MKKILKFFKLHLAEDFKIGYYILIIVFLVFCLIYNFKFDFEDKVIDRFHNSGKGFVYTILFYAFPYYFAFLTYVFFYRRWDLLKDYRFWTKSLFFILIFSFDSNFTFHTKIIRALAAPEARHFIIRCSNNFTTFFTIFLPLLVFYLAFEKNIESFYGLKFKDVDLKPYFILLLCMVPLVTIASFTKDFNTYYPRYPNTSINKIFQIPDIITITVFEACYGWDFLDTELFFRGALVIGMSSILGRGAIMPMVCFYVFIHFGKPVGEATSSMFGGYILGVIAYYTRNIWGGVCIHLGIAWMMEIAAFLQIK
jgi:hypothetical protein